MLSVIQSGMTLPKGQNMPYDQDVLGNGYVEMG